MVMGSASYLPPLFLLVFSALSFCSFDCFGDVVTGGSEIIETSPFTSAVAADAADLRGIFCGPLQLAQWFGCADVGLAVSTNPHTRMMDQE